MTAQRDSYYALALQTACSAVNGLSAADARTRMASTIDRIDRQIGGSKAFVGRDLALVVLPEYFLTGYPMGESLAGWRALAALDTAGQEYEALGRVAQRHDVHLAGNVYERDAHFPQLYFQTSFVIDTAGDVVLRYRRLNSMYAPTPHDVWDAYLDRYGIEGVFPVASTALGRLAAIASEEILFPELARCLALRGAEVFVHSTSEVCGDGDTPKDVAKRARAIENLAYVVSANSAGIDGTSIPRASTDGGSKIVDDRGLVLSHARPGESMACHAEVDLAALRRRRRRPGMANQLARQRTELYASIYRETPVHPANSLAGEDPDRAALRRAHEEAIRRLADAGVI